MDWKIHPLQGIGEIRFGFDVNRIRSLLGEPSATFLKTPSSVHPTDAFDALGIHVFYDADGKSEAIEMAKPARPILDGFELLKLPYPELLELLTRLDPSTRMDAGDALCPGIGISLYAPVKDEEPHQPVEAILIFQEGYLDP